MAYPCANLRELGERLRQCRKQRGLTQADAARDINVARTTLVAIEKGERQIKPKELIQLAHFYERPLSDFMASLSMTQPFAVQFRAAFRRTSEDDTQIQAIIQKFEQLCQNYLELEQLMESPLPQNYPPEYVEYENLNSSIDTIAESIAGRERQRLGLGNMAIEDCHRTLGIERESPTCCLLPVACCPLPVAFFSPVFCPI